MTSTRPEAWPTCSVVIATFNRAQSLRGTLDSVLHQHGVDAYDVIVVDNASTDDTAAVVCEYQQHHEQLRYVYEATKGQAAARNTGVHLSRAPLVAFTDDDVRPTATWLARLVAAAHAHERCACFGGRILPAWPSPPPAWLTRDHWVGALALQDYGEQPIAIDRGRALSLASASMLWRRDAFLGLNGFSTACLFTEDTEILMRLWRSSGRCLYVPDAVAIAEVQPERIGKAYHRQWHRRNGEWAARLALEESFDANGGLRDTPASGPTLFGIPSFMFRQFGVVAVRWIASALRRRESAAFAYEKQLWQISAYMRTCARRPRRPRGVAAEISSFLNDLWRRKRSGWSERRA